MSFDDLWELHEELTRILISKIAAEKLELEKRLALLHRSEKYVGQGSDVSFLEARAGSASSSTAGTKLAAKYRNTSPPYESWSGRGKRPRWLTRALNTGSKIEEFLVEPRDSSAQSDTPVKKP